MSETSTPAKERRWMTVPEAAAYLEISEPTIFRWMRDGTLSFLKIGGATRFSQEMLDAVVEKNTGRKEAESAAGRCPSCGHTTLMDGQLRGAGLLYFRPKKTRFWVLREAMVRVNAHACPACGLLQLHADADKLRKLEPSDKDQDSE